MLKKIKISRFKFGISLLFIPIFILSIFFVEFNKILFLISAVILFELIKRTYNSPVFFLAIFSSLFYLPFLFFYFFNWRISGYLTFNIPENVRETGRIFFLFQYVFFCSFKKNEFYEPISNRLHFQRNDVIFYGALLISIFLMVSSLSGKTILSSTYQSQIKIRTSMFEYVIPFVLIAYIFSGQDKIKTFILIGIILAYILKDLLFGGRVSSIQMGLLAYILFYDKKINFKYVLFWTLGAFVFLKGFEIFRTISGLTDNLFTIGFKSIFFMGNDIKTYGSNEGEVIHSSIRLIGMVNEGIISTQERLFSFFIFIFSAFNPGANLPPLANLASYLKSTYPSGGGGLFSIYFYVWGGYLGVILSALFVSTIINQFFKTKNMLLLIYTTMFLSTFPRWFAYNPIIILKLAIAPIYIYILIQQFYLLSRKNTSIQ